MHCTALLCRERGREEGGVCVGGRERKRERERERERNTSVRENIDWLLPESSWTRILHTQTGNRTCNLWVTWRCSNQLSHAGQTSLCTFKNYYFNTLSLENHKFKICFLLAGKVMTLIIKWLSLSFRTTCTWGVGVHVCAHTIHFWPRLSTILLDCSQDFLHFTSILRCLKISRSVRHKVMSEPKSS